jgi:hypothetical protein
VISVIWFIGFGGFIWSSEVRRIVDFLGWQLRTCVTILNMDNESLQYTKTREEREKKQAEIWAKYERCRKEASDFHGREADNLFKGIPILLAIDLCSIGLGWLVVWVVVLIVRWVHRGFVRV